MKKERLPCKDAKLLLLYIGQICMYVCVCVYVRIFLESLHVVLCVCIHSQSSLCLLYKDTNVH